MARYVRMSFRTVSPIVYLYACDRRDNDNLKYQLNNSHLKEAEMSCLHYLQRSKSKIPFWFDSTFHISNLCWSQWHPDPVIYC